MYTPSLRVAQTVLALLFVQVVQATIYVIAPLEKSTCRGGQDCLVQWLDNGVSPTLDNIGPCYIGLYNGDNVLVQQIEPVDVSRVHSLTFKPDPSAGPNSDTYYINFTSVNPIGNPPNRYSEYSPFFSLRDMDGSFSSPDPSATSLPSVPSSVANAPPNTIATTESITNTVIPSSSASLSPSLTPSSSSSSSAAPSSAATSSIASTPSASSSAAPAPSTPAAASSSSATESPSSSAVQTSSPSVSTPLAQPSSTLVVTPTFITSRTPPASSLSTSAPSAPAASVTGGAAASSAFRLYAPTLLMCSLGALLSTFL